MENIHRDQAKGLETPDTRICRTCEAEKPLNKDHYYFRSDSQQFRTECKECWKEAQLVQRLGVDYSFYHQQLKTQGHRCGICRCKLESSRYTKFAVDHCHKTGAVRGLLCTQCNTALGLFKESPRRLESALRYLQEHSGEDIV